MLDDNGPWNSAMVSDSQFYFVLAVTVDFLVAVWKKMEKAYREFLITMTVEELGE
jgi:hypothetical protein